MEPFDLKVLAANWTLYMNYGLGTIPNRYIGTPDTELTRKDLVEAAQNTEVRKGMEEPHIINRPLGSKEVYNKV